MPASNPSPTVAGRSDFPTPRRPAQSRANWRNAVCSPALTPGYRKEISVDTTLEAHGITLTLSGRIDGAWEDAGTLVVEEIKSTYFKLKDVPKHS